MAVLIKAKIADAARRRPRFATELASFIVRADDCAAIATDSADALPV